MTPNEVFSSTRPGTYAVSEQFLSFQGEGVYMGCAAYFVRLQGCDQKCSWCDSAETWHPDHKPSDIAKLNALEIVARMQSVAAPGTILVITGGEPTLYQLDPLVRTARAAGFTAHVETAGHHNIPRSIDWITLSPKVFATPPLPENIERANEFKIIVDSKQAIDSALSVILPRCRPKAAIWLHPEWSRRDDSAILELITTTVKANPRLRAGYQIHKLYRADQMDPGARAAKH